MAATAGSGPSPRFVLSPHQQELLFAALNSNKATLDTSVQHTTGVDPSTVGSFSESPMQQAPGSGTINGLDESPFIDYDYEFDGDGSFDYEFNNQSQDQMIGRLPGTSSDGDADADPQENHEKRGHEDDDENDEDGGGKRREGDDKVSKKPGRKPIMSEPTSKRKAQNRAAQRAFRERKEKHLKDLEDKVSDLEKASESANHENAILRAQVEKMGSELKSYRKKLSLSREPNFTSGISTYNKSNGLGNRAVNNVNDVNFQFEFPKFGQLPGPPVLDMSKEISASVSPQPPHRSSTSSSSAISPLSQNMNHNSSYTSFDAVSASPQTFGQNIKADMSEFSGLFSPTLLESVSKEYPFTQLGTHDSQDSSSGSDSRGHGSTGQSTSYSSPSASSNAASNNGMSSSCGTSPEPFGQSPAALKATDNLLGTIGEEQYVGNKLTETAFQPFEVNSLDWFAQQNGNQFDPQLFGDYREPQNNVLSAGLYDDSFFSDAFALPEFNNTSSPFALEASPAPVKKDLVAQIDQELNGEDEPVLHTSGDSKNGVMLTCNSMWEKIQACPTVQSGEIDMDQLCSQLQAKAKCSGEGPVINENDFKQVIRSMFPPGKDQCPK